MPPKSDPSSDESLKVKVFTEDGLTFLGTEILIRADLYGGQPCATDGGGEYVLLDAGAPFPIAYRACHHFDTSP